MWQNQHLEFLGVTSLAYNVGFMCELQIPALSSRGLITPGLLGVGGGTEREETLQQINDGKFIVS